MSDSGSRPRIVTFYSYKGGTGRSMALANVAWILAAHGKRVLVIDWDLEAPGLHRYFHPFLDDKELAYSDGVIDFVMRYAREASKPPTDKEDWYVPLANLRRYACSLRYPFSKPGTVDLVPAGRQGPDYATRVNSFNWQNFYERLDGGVFLEAAKRSVGGYDFVLVDSRTGVSDTSGICTVQMPDTLVICFSPNAQSIEGAAAVAESAVVQRLRVNQKSGLMIYPVITRVPQGETARVQLARREARKRFDPLLWQIPQGQRESYWGQMSVAHIDFYGFEEVLSVFADEPNLTNTMLASMEAIAGYLLRTREEAEALGQDAPLPSPLKFPPLGTSERTRLLAQFVRRPETPAPPPKVPVTALPVGSPLYMTKSSRAPEVVARSAGRYWFYLSYARQDNDSSVGELFQQLKAEIESQTGMQNVGFMDSASLQTSLSWEDTVAPIIASVRTFIPLISPSYLASGYCGREFQLFITRSAHSNSGLTGVLPLSWIPLRSQRVPAVLQSIQFHRHSDDRSGLRQLFNLRKNREAARSVIADLARSVLALAEQANLPILNPVPFWASLPNPFADTDSGEPRPQRAKVNFVFLAPTCVEAEAAGLPLALYGKNAASWKPFGRPIRDFAKDAIVSQNLSYEEFPTDAGLADRLREAEASRQGAICVVDNAALSIDRLGNMYQTVISLNLKNCWFLFVLQDSSGVSLRVIPPLKRATSVSSEHELTDWLQQVIDETRLRLISEFSESGSEAPSKLS